MEVEEVSFLGERSGRQVGGKPGRGGAEKGALEAG